MKMTRNVVRVGVLLSAFAATSAAYAADLPKEGNYEYSACFTRVLNRILFSETHSVSSYEQIGMTFTEPPGGMFDRGSVRCVGAASGIKGQTVFDTMHCEAIFPDGGKMLRRFTRQQDGGYATEVIAATGQYEGIVLAGSVKAAGTYPSVKPDTSVFCNRHSGTYKLR